MSLKLSGMISGMDTESMVAELMKAENLKKTSVQNKITTAEWKQDKWKALNSKLYSFYTGTLSKLKMQGNFNTKKITTSDDSKVAVTANTTAPEGAQTLIIKQLAKAQNVTSGVIDLDKNSKDITADTLLTDLKLPASDGTNTNTISVTTASGTKTLTIDNTKTVRDFVQLMKDAGLNASYDTTQNRFFISSKESGTKNAFSLSTSSASVDLANLGLNAMSVNNGVVTATGTANMSLVQPQDAKVNFNGADITDSTNVMSINGLTLTLKGVSTGADTASPTPINLNITKDTQAVYDMIKNFVKGYNDLLNEMNTDYNATSAKGYEPLTDDQKANMTDSQIEQWESKIKDSLLRRDSNLGSVINEMRSTLSDSIPIDGKNYSLSSFGISTVSYTEKGKLHIEGDSEDDLTSVRENKLMESLTNEPEKVMAVINGLADKLYSNMTKDMKSSSVRSALTLYNDKEITNQIKGYKDDLKKLETKLSNIESRYYKQFSAMESAMSKMNSQSSKLSSMLGK